MKLKILFAVISIFVVEVLFSFYINRAKELAVHDFLNARLLSLQVAKKAILNTYSSVNKKYYYDVLHNEDVINLLRKIKYTQNKKEIALLRGKLYRLLYKEYDLLKELGVRQFHFHTYDGRSLLRFHMPYLNGDSLVGVRQSIDFVMKTHKPFAGFEGGRVYSGFRYVFPILDGSDYLGSVEFSMKFDTVAKDLQQILPSLGYEFIVKKSESYDRAFSQYRSLFKMSDFGDQYFSEDSFVLHGKALVQDKKIIQIITQKVKQSHCFKENFAQNRSFVSHLIYNNQGYSVLFLNIEDNDKKHIGYIISFEKSPEVLTIDKQYNKIFFMGSFVLVLVLVLIIVLIIQFNKVQTESQKLQKFIDIQDAIVVLTDGEHFYYANRSFLEFFGYSSLEEFLKDHNCICEFFIENSSFFSLKDVKEDEAHWVESLLKLPGRKRIVSMIDHTITPHAFSVSIGHYDESKYVVSFSDISDTMEEKIQIQNQMLRDQLTNAYNRLYFDENIERLVNIHKAKGKYTGIIFFDIDHFKNVNDTYGHDVGDSVLTDVVSTVKNHIRQSDKLIRWGGEEFIIVVPIHTFEELYNIAEHLRKAIAQHHFNIVEHITCSFGISMYDENEDPLINVKKADEKLYKAKENGRNRVEK